MEGASQGAPEASADGGSTEEEFSSSSSVVSLNLGVFGAWRQAKNT
jgi:hypothetical protein